jgi:hypothetical protein
MENENKGFITFVKAVCFIVVCLTAILFVLKLYDWDNISWEIVSLPIVALFISVIGCLIGLAILRIRLLLS